jgi:hypothetical protein
MYCRGSGYFQRSTGSALKASIKAATARSTSAGAALDTIGVAVVSMVSMTG